MRIPGSNSSSRRSRLVLLVLLLLHLTCCLAHSHWGYHRGGVWRLKHNGKRNHGRHRRKEGFLLPPYSSSASFLAPSTTAETPYFDSTAPTHIKAQLGSNAYLPCKIRNLGNKSVSWVRNKDAHILSVDRYIFITDARFAAWHQAEKDTWTLQVKFVEASDAGRYECQVSTEPKMSHFVHLEVISPRVTIPGGSELHVKSGSTVSIKCVVSHALHPPSYVFWYHGDQRIPDTPSWDGVSPGEVMGVAEGASVASLTIASVSQAHEGNYTCSPASLTPVSVTLHVLNGERPAAMQHGTSDTPRLLPPTTTLLTLLLFLTPFISLLLTHAPLHNLLQR